MRIKIPTSFRRYRVSARPRESVEKLLERLSKRRFMPLDAETEEDERWGWISTGHLLDVRFEQDRCLMDPYLMFALRMDKRRAPAGLVRAHVALEMEAHFAAHGKRMKAADKRDLKEEVERKLKAKTLPSATSVPVMWSLTGRTVYFGATSARSNELFQVLFPETFELELLPLDAAGLAEDRIARDDAAIDRMAMVQPTRFQPTGAGA